jgi:hypothetical protein
VQARAGRILAPPTSRPLCVIATHSLRLDAESESESQARVEVGAAMEEARDSLRRAIDRRSKQRGAPDCDGKGLTSPDPLLRKFTLAAACVADLETNQISPLLEPRNRKSLSAFYIEKKNAIKWKRIRKAAKSV